MSTKWIDQDNPDDFVEEYDVKFLPEGEIGYVVPWAIHVIEGRYFIKKNYSYDREPHGTSVVPVRRRGITFEVLDTIKPSEISKGSDHHYNLGLYLPVILLKPTTWQRIKAWLFRK